MISIKNKTLFMNSIYANIDISFMNDALFSINNGKLYNGAVFLTENSLILLAKNFEKEIILGAMEIVGEKRGVIYQKVNLKDSIDGLNLNIEFTSKKEKEKFIEIFSLINRVIIETYHASVYNPEENVEEEKSDENSKTLPYEELKQLKELLDMGILTQDEFDRKKSQLLEDYL